MLVPIKSLFFIKRFSVKQYILLLCAIFSLFSYAMDKQLSLQPKKIQMILLTKDEMAYISSYMINSAIKTEQKNPSINTFKSRKKRRV
jgi:hypothetical protein